MAGVTKSEVKVGIMVLLSSALMILLTITVGQIGDLWSDTITVEIAIPSVVGLEKYAPVTYSGVKIGTVIDIQYDETLGKAIIKAEINRDSPVCLDSECRFTSSSMLSPIFIEISGGSRDKRIRQLLADGQIKEIDIRLGAEPYLSIGDIFALAGDVKNTLSKVETVLDNLNEPLAVAGGLVVNVSNEIQAMLGNFKKLLTDGDDLIVRVLTNADGLIVSASSELVPALKDVRESAKKFPPMIANADKKLTRAMDGVDELITEIKPQITQLSQNLQETASALREKVDTLEKNLSTLLANADGVIVENRNDIDTLIDYLRRTSKNLDDITAQISDNPWRLVWKTDPQKEPLKLSPEWDPLPEKSR